jgi:reactive intermediate/imine deaminase
MKKEIFSSPQGPKAIGPYSPVVKAGNMIFVSGQIPIDPKTNTLPEGIEKQTVQVLENLKLQLTVAGCGSDAIVQCTIYTTKLGDFGKINEIYAKYFKEPFPTRAVIGVSELPKGSLIEIVAIAMQ